MAKPPAVRRDPLTRNESPGVEIGLNAAIVAVHKDEPVLLIVREDQDAIGASDSLPYGPFSPLEHRTLEIGLRAWVREQTGIDFGYVEQLYTFGDRGRHAQVDDRGPHVVSIGYLALTHIDDGNDHHRGTWRSWYQYFPWEDWRRGRPAVLDDILLPRLSAWAAQPPLRPVPGRPVRREDRLRMYFGTDGGAWDEEKVLDRYELLYEAGLIDEARRDRPELSVMDTPIGDLGTAMIYDHRRILATAMSRIRAKIKYRPVIFELMPPDFTLFELQKTVEAILGPHLHKQNFRRLVESAGLVEPTGEMKTRTGGRPAKLFRFRREVLLERPAPGVRVKPGRA
ncbi:MAG: NAD regulator [Hyphomicrobiaceae bacterium]|nr:NAD regulator [Hyphomicrobiaceae bacterium]